MVNGMEISNRLRIDRDADTPIVVQLTEQLTWLIASGVVEAGDTLPTIRDLADELGIHMHTVREAYHRLEADRLVSVRTRRGTVVLPFDAVHIAGNQPEQRSFLVGVLVPAPVAVYRPFLQGIQEAAASHGWLPLIASTHDNPFLTERYLHQLITKNVDGFIVTSPGEIARLEQAVDTARLPPLIYVDAPHITHDSVNADSEGAAFAATGHLLEHGHRRIGLITAPLDWENVAPCYAGYRRALEQAGLEVDRELIVEVPDFDLQSGYRGASELIDRQPMVEAVFVVADALALGALQALRERGVAVPGDIAIASYNDIESAALVSPPLTTAVFPAYEMGIQAALRLSELVAGRDLEREAIILDCPLVIRESCGCNQ